MCAPAAWGRNASARRLYVHPVVRPLFVLPLVSFLSSFGGPAPGGLPRPAGFRRRASGVAASRFRGPSSGLQVATSSTPGAVGRCRSMRIRGRETEGRGRDHGQRRAAGLRASLAVRNHSPTGPSQLALAILLPATDEATAERFYQPFQGSVIARVEAGRWTLATRPRLARVGGRTYLSCTWRCTRGKCAPAAWGRTCRQQNGRPPFWHSILDSTDTADFEAHLEQFPSGVFRRLARDPAGDVARALGWSPASVAARSCRSRSTRR